MDAVKWGPNRKKELADRLHFEVSRALTQRTGLEKKWRDYLELYRAPDELAQGYSPIEGASRRTYPLAAMNVDPILARFLRTIHAPGNIWTCAPLNERWVKAAKPLQDLLEFLDHRLLKMFDVNYRVLLETLKLGTGIFKTSWRFERRPVVGVGNDGKRLRMMRELNAPVVDSVSLANLLLPPEARNIDPDDQGGAMWVAERMRFRVEVLRQMAKSQQPVMPSYDSAAIAEILKYEESHPTEHDQTVQRLDRLDDSHAIAWKRPIELWEIHIRFDSSGDGSEDDLIVLFHLPSMQIARAIYAPMPFRPYSAVRYLRGDGFYGIGICEQIEMFQGVASQLLNFDIDRMFFANAPMLAVREGANIIPGEPIFPGKVWSLADPSKDIQSIFLANPGAFDIASVRQSILEASKQRSGMTDLQFGTVGSIPSRTPATTIQSLLQEGNTRLDLSLQDIRGGLSDVGLKVLQHLQYQIGNTVDNSTGREKWLELIPAALGMPEGVEVAQKLLIPFEPIEQGLGVTLTATSGTANKELQKQSFLGLMQIINQQAPMILQMAQMAMQAQGTPLGEVASQLLRGEQELLQRLLEQFDIRNPEAIIPDLEVLFPEQQQGQAQGGPEQMQQMMPMDMQGGMGI